MNWIWYIIVMSLSVGLIVALIVLDLYGGTKWVEPDPLNLDVHEHRFTIIGPELLELTIMMVGFNEGDSPYYYVTWSDGRKGYFTLSQLQFMFPDEVLKCEN